MSPLSLLSVFRGLEGRSSTLMRGAVTFSLLIFWYHTMSRAEA